LFGLPSAAIPLGLGDEGLPIGVQIVGRWLEDRTRLKLAELIERAAADTMVAAVGEYGGFIAPPMFGD
jgi:amidase